MSSPSNSRPHPLMVTGGIACGKSTFAAIWQQKNPDTLVFCADKAVHELYIDPDVGRKVADLAGDDVLAEHGSVDRAALRQKVFDDVSLRGKLEALIHPLVREMFQKACSEAENAGMRWILADVPLYFEGGGEFIPAGGMDSNLLSTIVVACSKTTQIERLLQRNGFDNARSESIIRSQMPVSEKILKADFVIWNEGAEQVLHRQTELLSRTLEVLRK